jgi:hypothetical protein
MISFNPLCEKAASALPALVIFTLVCFWGAALPRSAHSQEGSVEERLDALEKRMDRMEEVFGLFIDELQDELKRLQRGLSPNYETDKADNACQSAHHNIQLAEEAYFVQFSEYTADYKELQDKAALTFDPNVTYGQITLVTNPQNGQPGYQFTVRSKQFPNIGYKIDSSSDAIVTKLHN